jgi:hypothetical protein
MATHARRTKLRRMPAVFSLFDAEKQNRYDLPRDKHEEGSQTKRRVVIVRFCVLFVLVAGMVYEVPHAVPADGGSYVCMVAHTPNARGRSRPERLLSEPAAVVIDEGSREGVAGAGLARGVGELVHAPLMPMTPRGRERRELSINAAALASSPAY